MLEWSEAENLTHGDRHDVTYLLYKSTFINTGGVRRHRQAVKNSSGSVIQPRLMDLFMVPGPGEEGDMICQWALPLGRYQHFIVHWLCVLLWDFCLVGCVLEREREEREFWYSFFYELANLQVILLSNTLVFSKKWNWIFT